MFLALAGIAALMAVGVVALNNPVRSAMCLVVNFFVLAFIYFTLNAQLIGITQIMVYAGAIMVLFLFVIMLLNMRNPQLLKEKFDLRPLAAVPLGLAMMGVIASQVLLPLKDITAIKSDPTYGSPRAVGMVLFADYAYPFEVTSILLLIGVVGSVLLAKRRVQ